MASPVFVETRFDGVVVDRAGAVRWVTFDPAAELPGRSIRDWLAP